MENVFALLPAALALMGSPGPVTLASAAFGAAWGWRAARLVLAMTAGTATIIMAVAVGLLGLVAVLPGAGPVLMVLGGLYMLYLAWRIWSAPPLSEHAPRATMPAALGVYVAALANPKAWAAFAALFSGFPLIEGDALANGIVKAAMLICLATCINLSWMSAGAMLARLFRDPLASRRLNRVFAVALIGSVGAMALL